MDNPTRLISLWVVAVCIIATGLAQQTPPGNEPGPPPPAGDDMGPNKPDGMGRSSAEPKPPVWLQCMAEVSGRDVSSEGIKDIFETWCSNYEKIVDCLTSNLPTSAESNPFDFFISLDFDPDRLREDSKGFCSMLADASGQLSCSDKQNKTLATVCGHAFTRGLFHIYGLFKEKNAPQEVLSQIACDMTTQTTFCLRQTLNECPPQVQSTLINYYALFTNGSCVAGEDYQPPSPPPRRPDTVVVKCAAEASDSLESDPVEPSSVVDFVVLGLKTDCKTYPTRFSCYDRELRNITNFLDFWLSLTFDLNNAMMSQKAYCDKIDGKIIPKLTSECFNKSQPGLAACETGFGQEVETIRREWVQNPDFDGLQLQKLACRTSVTRAVCLGDAMIHCGEEVAMAMKESEMGILPDVCKQLLTTSNDQTTDGNGDMSRHSNPDYGTHTVGEGGRRERPVNDMGYKKEHRGAGGNMIHEKSVDGSGNQMAGGNHMNDGNNKKNMDGGVGVVYANVYVISVLLSSLLVSIL